MSDTFKLFEFNYSSFNLKPYLGNTGSSSQLLKDIILKLRETDFPSDKRIIDRFEKRSNSPKRKLIIVSHRFDDSGRRCFGKIALIKNKAPLLLGEGNIIEEIEKGQSKEFIEITNYVINYNVDSDPVIMFEYNYEGPRLSDFEFYIRQIAKEFKIAKNIKYILHLNSAYEQLDNTLINVFGINVKINSLEANKTNWLKSLQNIEDDTGFKDVRLEFFYKRVKDLNGVYYKNEKGLSFAKKLINWLKFDENNIEHLED